MTIGDNDDLAFRVADETIQKVNHNRLREAPIEYAKPHLAQVVDGGDDIATEPVARTANDRRFAARRITAPGQMITSQTRLVLPVDLGFFPLCPPSKRRILTLEPVANPIIIAFVSARDRLLRREAPASQKATHHPQGVPDAELQVDQIANCLARPQCE